jgi:hypothetical protein
MIRKALEFTSDFDSLTPAEKSKIAGYLYLGITGPESADISMDLKNEMAVRSSQLLGAIPLDHCGRCNKPVFIHESKKIGDKYYCDVCCSSVSI